MDKFKVFYKQCRELEARAISLVKEAKLPESELIKPNAIIQTIQSQKEKFAKALEVPAVDKDTYQEKKAELDAIDINELSDKVFKKQREKRQEEGPLLDALKSPEEKAKEQAEYQKLLQVPEFEMELDREARLRELELKSQIIKNMNMSEMEQKLEQAKIDSINKELANLKVQTDKYMEIDSWLNSHTTEEAKTSVQQSITHLNNLEEKVKKLESELNYVDQTPQRKAEVQKELTALHNQLLNISPPGESDQQPAIQDKTEANNVKQILLEEMTKLVNQFIASNKVPVPQELIDKATIYGYTNSGEKIPVADVPYNLIWDTVNKQYVEGMMKVPTRGDQNPELPSDFLAKQLLKLFFYTSKDGKMIYNIDHAETIMDFVEELNNIILREGTKYEAPGSMLGHIPKKEAPVKVYSEYYFIYPVQNNTKTKKSKAFSYTKENWDKIDPVIREKINQTELKDYPMEQLLWKSPLEGKDTTKENAQTAVSVYTIDELGLRDLFPKGKFLLVDMLPKQLDPTYDLTLRDMTVQPFPTVRNKQWVDQKPLPAKYSVVPSNFMYVLYVRPQGENLRQLQVNDIAPQVTTREIMNKTINIPKAEFANAQQYINNKVCELIAQDKNNPKYIDSVGLPCRTAKDVTSVTEAVKPPPETNYDEYLKQLKTKGEGLIHTLAKETYTNVFNTFFNNFRTKDYNQLRQAVNDNMTPEERASSKWGSTTNENLFHVITDQAEKYFKEFIVDIIMEVEKKFPVQPNVSKLIKDKRIISSVNPLLFVSQQEKDQLRKREDVKQAEQVYKAEKTKQTDKIKPQTEKDIVAADKRRRDVARRIAAEVAARKSKGGEMKAMAESGLSKFDISFKNIN